MSETTVREQDQIVAKISEAAAHLESAGACAALIHDVGSQLHSRQEAEKNLAEHVINNPNFSTDQIAQHIREIAGQCPNSGKIDASRSDWEERFNRALVSLREAGELARKVADRERTRVSRDVPPYLPVDTVED